MPTTHFVSIQNQPYEVRSVSDFYFNKVTVVIASFSSGVDVRSLNECAEAIKTAIIPSVPGRTISYNPVTESYYWNISEDEISELLLRIYEVKLLIDIESLQENGADQLLVESALEKLKRFREARQQDADNESMGSPTNVDAGTDTVQESSSDSSDSHLKEMQKQLAEQE